MSSIQITRKSFAAHTGAVSQFLSKNETYLKNFRIVYLNFHAKDAFYRKNSNSRNKTEENIIQKSC